ncbi:MAG: aminotransferase class V-fold PLP-dependent enzyme [Opitutaceae bacterium]|jgi:8-amino-3,8-dideoxy-alpha-D-manno-octulosonate transaminase|nr:aminotransferase class V-fold PLP-dependent enzyme [Opitutaceae bacterium]
MNTDTTTYTRPALGLGSAALDEQEEQAAVETLRSRNLFRYYGDDPENPPTRVTQLEKTAVAWIGTDYALAMSSGTAALETALAAISVGPGDEVIVPAWSWLSCVTTIVRMGARPVLAEIDDSLNLDPNEIQRLKTDKTRAVMVVHYQGVAADMDKIIMSAHKLGLFVIEDCAEAPGTRYKGRPVGAWGDVAIYSFQHNKPMTAGEGGMLVTRDIRTYERAVRMHDLGQYRPYHHATTPPQEPAFSGANYRMSELTASVALVQLKKVDAIKSHCRILQQKIRDEVGELPGITWRTMPDSTGDFGFEMYFYLEDPDNVEPFQSALNALKVNCLPRTGTYPQYYRENILTGRAHHPAASPFRDLKPWPAPGYRPEDFPVTENLTRRFIALPLGWKYTPADATHIAHSLKTVHQEILG